MACAGPKASSLLQISFTFIGLLVTLSGASFGGEIRSRIFCQRTLEVGCQSTVMREDTAFGVGLNHSLKLSETPLPKPSGVNTAPWPFLGTLIGRSARKSLRLEKKPRERGFCEPARRGAESPAGSLTFGGGVPGSLHLGEIVLKDSCLILPQCPPKAVIPGRQDWMPGGTRLT